MVARLLRPRPDDDLRLTARALRHTPRPAAPGGAPSPTAMPYRDLPPGAGPRRRVLTGRLALAAGLLLLLAAPALAHDVAEADRGFLQATGGVRFAPFAYLGAKHMVTGLDHLLFLAGVVFFLYRLRDVGLYVTLFAVGHSATLIVGVLTGLRADAHLVDAVIGLSVVYKALDNLGALRRWFGVQPDTRAATFLFGLIHGLGLATKLLDLRLSPDGLVVNLVAFNVGVEVGQVLALGAILLAMGYWRRTASFARHAALANVALLAAGLVLTGQQVAGFLASTAA